ncbi:hypothetical protein V9L05_17175 [Bernardetia sp. Wsw4-3y2]|uniref:hypothetical protein n=1 Tax=unclassified Bernardetia TaxID=2647129 RepID=UPI0030D2A766
MNNLVSISTEDYMYAMQQRNLVYNCNFIYFSNQKIVGNTIEYGIPDGWIYNGNKSDGSLDFDTTQNQLIIKKGASKDEVTLKQALDEFPRGKSTLLGKTITAKFFITTDTEGDVTFSISDGADSSTKVRAEKGTNTISVQHQVSQNTTKVYLSIKTSTPNMTIRINKIVANIGLVALENLPCIVEGVIGQRKQYIATETSPIGELSLCKEPMELSENYTRLDSVINGRFGRGAGGRSFLIDMRGYFSRAWNNGSTIDPDASKRTAPNSGTITGDHVSTFEEDIFLKHDHGLNYDMNTIIATGDKGAAMTVNKTANSKTNPTSEGKETRPKNIAELYTIKWA